MLIRYTGILYKYIYQWLKISATLKISAPGA